MISCDWSEKLGSSRGRKHSECGCAGSDASFELKRRGSETLGGFLVEFGGLIFGKGGYGMGITLIRITSLVRIGIS